MNVENVQHKTNFLKVVNSHKIISCDKCCDKSIVTRIDIGDTNKVFNVILLMNGGIIFKLKNERINSLFERLRNFSYTQKLFHEKLKRVGIWSNIGTFDLISYYIGYKNKIK